MPFFSLIMKNIFSILLVLGAFFTGTRAGVYQNINQLTATTYDFIVIGGQSLIRSIFYVVL